MVMRPSKLRRARPIGMLAAGLFFAALPASAAYREEVGLAADLDSGEALYREQHLMRAAPDGGLLERLVVYRCVDGTPFARKRVDYRGAAAAPSFQFEDVRSGYREGVSRTGSDARVFVDRPDAEPQQAPLPEGNLDLSHWFLFGTAPRPLAELGAQRFMRALQDAAAVRTDRLHVAITAGILGRPVEFHPNNYFKCRAVYEHSMIRRTPSVRWVE
jgi:hypothetical protein